jgi:hypothetical protein
MEPLRRRQTVVAFDLARTCDRACSHDSDHVLGVGPTQATVTTLGGQLGLRTPAERRSPSRRTDLSCLGHRQLTSAATSTAPIKHTFRRSGKLSRASWRTRADVQVAAESALQAEGRRFETSRAHSDDLVICAGHQVFPGKCSKRVFDRGNPSLTAIRRPLGHVGGTDRKAPHG